VEHRRVGLLNADRKFIGQRPKNSERVGSLDTGNRKPANETPGIRRDGLFAKKIEGGVIPKGIARGGNKDPEGEKSRRGAEQA
jgi:hypothetical protein